MPMTSADKRWWRILLMNGVVAGGCLLGSGGVSAQGLDMDASPSAPLPATPQAAAPQSGGLDMNVNPDAPIASKPAVQAMPRDKAQDGITPLSAKATPAAVQDGIAPLNPLSAKATPDGASPPAATPLDAPASPAPASPAIISPAIATQSPEPTPVSLDHPKVVDTATLQAGETTVTLYGVEGIAGESAQGLQSYLAATDGHMSCQAQPVSGFVCLLSDGTNVAQVALVNGAAKTTPDAPDSYREQENAAQAARRGIWVNLPPPPETVKHPIVQDTATLAASGKTYVLDGVVGFTAPYAGQMQGYIAGNGDSMTCSPQSASGLYVCLLPDGTDIAKVALVNGAARVGPDAPDAYRVQQLDAINNRRGYWLTAPDAVMTAALLPQQDVYVLVAGDDGVDGITYVGGAPMALIDGEPTFLVYGDDGLGWGYYDHYHHWRGAPDRYRRHMEHFHPGGHGLRGHDGFHRDIAGRGHEEAGRRDAGMRREAEARPGMGHPGEGRPGEGRPGESRGGAGHPGEMRAGGAHPGMGGPAGAHPGNTAMAGGRPGGAAAGGGFMHPGAGASAGGFHPGGGGGGAAMHTASAAPHGGGGGGGGGGGKHK
jgi:endonuclease YncB( thermonuclease family)